MGEIVRAVAANADDVYQGKAFYGQEPGAEPAVIGLYRYATPSEETAGLTLAVERRDDIDAY